MDDLPELPVDPDMFNFMFGSSALKARGSTPPWAATTAGSPAVVPAAGGLKRAGSPPGEPRSKRLATLPSWNGIAPVMVPMASPASANASGLSTSPRRPAAAETAPPVGRSTDGNPPGSRDATKRVAKCLLQADFMELLKQGPFWNAVRVNRLLQPPFKLDFHGADYHLNQQLNQLIFERASSRRLNLEHANVDTVEAHIVGMKGRGKAIESRFDILLGLNEAGFSATPMIVTRAANKLGLEGLQMYRPGQPLSAFVLSQRKLP